MPVTRSDGILEGVIERIGLPEANFWVKGMSPADNFSRSVTAPDHTVAVGVLMDGIEERLGRDALAAVGFRVAQMLPIPRRYEVQGVRRYGFHGWSYAFLMGALACLAGTEAAQGRVVLAHLGNGASLAAVRGGKPVDTSMGFTPAAGVPMSIRSGDLDPGLVWYLARTKNMSAKQFNEMANSQSGLLGMSETSSDMRDLLDREAQDVRAAEAVALFCYQIKKGIGAYAAALGGLDTLVFAGGIGEHAPMVRARICDGLGFLGIELDEQCNTANEAVISR